MPEGLGSTHAARRARPRDDAAPARPEHARRGDPGWLERVQRATANAPDQYRAIADHHDKKPRSLDEKMSYGFLRDTLEKEDRKKKERKDG